MKLKVRNLAKIKSADIIVDGITVIAGENNTGKSTIGKTLFSLFNSISDIEYKINRQRVKEIEESCRSFLKNHIISGDGRRSIFPRIHVTARNLAARISRILEDNDKIEAGEIYEIVEQTLQNLGNHIEQLDVAEEFAEGMTKKIMEILDLPAKVIIQEILSRFFNQIFHGQINTLKDADQETELELEVKGKKFEVAFNCNECSRYATEFTILNNAIYIDNPFVVDQLGGWHELNAMEQHLRELLTDSSGEGLMDGIIGSVLAKEKMTEIYRALEEVIEGQIVEKEDEFYLKEEGYQKPVSVSNLSTGMKSFVIIKMLVEKGLIKEKDVLILDEPEIHLHPQWQVVYAEVIVLLQKYFDLCVVVTTHSPYFLDAINLFSIKHGSDKKVNYYLASLEDGSAKMECVTGDIDMIYKKMSSPIQMLDTLRDELKRSDGDRL
ncbi:MAG: ATP-binding protein [Roseburia sp.]|nr:ATP-binding protein [Roseburia sp.]